MYRNGASFQEERHVYGTVVTNFPLAEYSTIMSAEPGPALSKLLNCEGGAGTRAEGAILSYVGHLQLISTLKIVADCCQLCQYKLTKPNLTYPNPEE